ncbi:hypothetical protein [Gordonia sp. (in: high G+C Gram-positive bacteria)]|jgi:hypothetical protein|uniref:hypothetical protein n=1 Tax=Gordonia sp. (in: high G+C Gram-positive bacteria) TaxID=84139 RepID=UPI001DEF0C8F|nr:hypothetical protein [Gordonia sp. (in: high G+C Gram-positive bacteria)]MCB1293935.1 hypothetical protein [Gordonia sp. (in: high G+C Gram-positive bacteria)]HMS75680.1 hypothetical protein [Gordonia sp. (in: high G+C Gram-positive bacteria)]
MPVITDVSEGCSRRNRGYRLTVALLAASALVVGCSGDDELPVPSGAATTTTNANVYEQQRAEAVTALLDKLSKAVTAGDAKSLAGLMDDSATPAFRKRLETAAANFGARPQRTASPTTGSPAPSESRGPSPAPARPLPDDSRGTALRPATFKYQLVLTDAAEMQAPESVTDKLTDQGSSDVWVTPVALRYALGGAQAPGIDEPELDIDQRMVVARYGDDWKVVGDATLVGGRAPATMLWEFAGLRVADVHTAGGTSVIASYPGTADLVDRARGLLPDAVQAVESFWGSQWPRRVAVVTTGTAGQFTGLSGAPEADGAAAAATVFTGIDADKTVRGQRIVLTPNARQIPAPALGVVLRHEITHVATRSITSVKAPLWVTEGLAEYVGRKGTYRRLADAAPDLAAAVRAGSAPRTLPTDADFAVSGPKAGLTYQSAWSLWAFMASKFGEDKIKNLYRKAAAGDAAAADAAIASELKVTSGDLVTQWRRWLTQATA